MTKRYHRNHLCQAIAAVCLAVAGLPAAIPAPACAATVTVSAPEVGPHNLVADEDLIVTSTGSITGGATFISVQADGGVAAGSVSNSGDLSNQLGILVQGASTLDSITNNDGGVITGAGGLGDGAIHVGGNSAITGMITNSAGGNITSVNNGIRIVSSAAGGIVNSGAIAAGRMGIWVESSTVGTIANSGTIQGALAAIRIDAPVAPVTINNSGELIGAVILTDSTLNLDGASGRVTGPVSGAGSTVNVNGAFTSENTFAVDFFNIASGGVFNMADTVSVVEVFNNRGTLSVAAGDTVTINGPYHQHAGGVFQTGVSSSANYGRLVVNDGADLIESSRIDVKVNPGATLANGDVLADVLSATGLDMGTPQVTDNRALWNFIAAKDGNTIDLTADQQTFVEAAGSLGVTPVATGVAGALDAIQSAGLGGELGGLIGIFNEFTDAEFAEALPQLMPVFAGSGTQIALRLAEKSGAQVVHDRMGGGQGLSSGDQLLKDRVAWAQPFYSWTGQSERKGVAGYDADSYGLAVGADGQVSKEWRLGAAISVAKAEVDGDSPVTRDNLDIETAQASLYATGQLSEATRLNLQAGVGASGNDSSRHIQFGGMNRLANGDYASWHTLLDAEVEHLNTVNSKTTLTAYLRGQYAHVRTEGYDETGAGALNLRVDDNDEDSLIVTIGGKGAYAVSEQVKLTGHLGVGYDLMAGQASVSAAFTGGGPTFVTEGLNPSPYVMRGGIGFEMLAANGLTVTAQYDVDGREDYTSQVASIKFQMPF